MKKTKSILTMAALAVGMGLGFGVAFTPAQADAQQGFAECVRDYHCDSIKVCGEPNAAVCSFGRCVCVR
ncbi:hypothetical protein [Hyalangium gracile]|uniref:hypothetical protein n=1 Tax=Hyalangium gracile TaxID=394092 RepID=UPI001CCC67E3|nr:hypothetical protein [Hyalangium gracile]